MKNVLRSYIVKNSKEILKITGRGDNKLWESAHCLTDFISPWDSKDVHKIEFKSLWDKYKIVFFFKVNDSEVHIDPADDSIKSINNSDRVELFFRSDQYLDPYYCLEIDPLGRIMDFMARPDKQFDFNWNWKHQEIEVKSAVSTTFFTVEIAISLSSMTNLGLLKNGRIETGIYRAKYNRLEDGNFDPTWITWVDPNTKMPNFHISSSFGVLELEEF